MYVYRYSIVRLNCVCFLRPKEKQDTYEVLEKEDSFYKKGEIGKSHKNKQKHLEHRLNRL